MKKNFYSSCVGIFISLLIILPSNAKGQNEKTVVKKYLSELPKGQRSKTLHKYRMTAVYTNRDLYGNFTSKTRVTGDYTRGLPGDTAMWDNVYISASNKFSDPFTDGTKPVSYTHLTLPTILRV